MKKIFGFLILLTLSILLCGCTTSTYIGNDFQESNLTTIKTNEDFVFSAYKKQDGNANIKIGISKTTITEILVLFIQIENLSYETPYTFKVNDLRVSGNNEEIKFITTNNYLSIYQTQETASMNSISSIAPTITTMTGMSTNYNDYNQSRVQNSAQSTTKSTYSTMENLGNKILSHSIQVSSTISPRKSKYFYFFFENPDELVKVKYKNLIYQFKV